MSKFDDFNARIARTRSQADRDIASDRTGRAFGNTGDGPWVLFLEAALHVIGQILSTLLPYLIGGIFLVGTVAVVFDISFMTALWGMVLLVVVLAGFALGNS